MPRSMALPLSAGTAPSAVVLLVLGLLLVGAALPLLVRGVRTSRRVGAAHEARARIVELTTGRPGPFGPGTRATADVTGPDGTTVRATFRATRTGATYREGLSVEVFQDPQDPTWVTDAKYQGHLMLAAGLGLDLVGMVLVVVGVLGMAG